MGVTFIEGIGPEAKVRVISTETIKRCPLCILVASHYKPDGSCYCFDAEEIRRRAVEKSNRREMIKKVVERQKLGGNSI